MTEKIGVVGFGKIGQAVAANILRHGLPVTAVDTDPRLKDIFLKNLFTASEPSLREILTRHYRNKKLEITTDYALLSACHAALICIPLLTGAHHEILSGPFGNCFASLEPHLAGGSVVAVETSVPVGFCRNFILPILEKHGKSHGKDFFLIHSPERIKSGSMMKQLTGTLKIIGGINDAATDKGMEWYGRFFTKRQLRKVPSIETAEMIKLAGMVYRDINIALSNQLALFADKAGIDLTEVIKLANTDGEAFLLEPGIGVGGHCTPVYPYFLIQNFHERGIDFTLAKEARTINDGMAAYAWASIRGKLRRKKVLLLGLGFRPGVKEDSCSTAYRLKEVLEKENITFGICDPLYSREELKSRGFEPVEDIYACGAEALFLLTVHPHFERIDWKRLRKTGCRILVDGRNHFEKDNIEEAGITYIGIGKS